MMMWKLGIRWFGVGVLLVGLLASREQIARGGETKVAAMLPTGSCDAGPIGSPIALATPEAATPIARLNGPSVDQAGFIDVLRAGGATVEAPGAIVQPFLHPVSGTLLRLSGRSLKTPIEIQAFEYADAAAAAADASQICPDGNLSATMIEWIAPPHFFRAGRLIVLYVGDNRAALDLLGSLLGPQFAGR